MNKEKLNGLLDSIYELEGLVHLAITRDDEPAMLPELIRRKSRELLAHAENVTSIEELATKNEVELSDVKIEDSVEEAKPVIEQSDDSDEEPIENSGENVEMREPVIEKTDEGAEVEEDKSIMPKADVLTIPEPLSEPEPPVVKETYKFEEYTEPRGRLVFSINDRYRFKRELFHGSDVDFNTTLSLVASMEGYEEAEDYFLNELQWDEKSPDVIDFLEILKNYFK